MLIIFKLLNNNIDNDKLIINIISNNCKFHFNKLFFINF